MTEEIKIETEHQKKLRIAKEKKKELKEQEDTEAKKRYDLGERMCSYSASKLAPPCGKKFNINTHVSKYYCSFSHRFL